jgi:hypothetical protein
MIWVSGDAASSVKDRRTDLKGSVKAAVVLAGDTVAVCGEAHGLEQRHRRLARDVLSVGRSEPAGRRQSNGGVRRARIIDRGRVEHLADSRA